MPESLRCCLCGSADNLEPPDEDGAIACARCYDRAIAGADRAIAMMDGANLKRQAELALPPLRRQVDAGMN